MTISYQPWYQGDTYPDWDIPLNTDAGADDITGYDLTRFTMTFHASTGADTLGTGVFSLKTLSPAEVYYRPSAADVASTFNGTVIVKAISPDSTNRTVIWDPITFVITAS